MIKIFSHLYIKQFFRLLYEIGIVRIILLVILGLLVILPVFFKFSTNPIWLAALSLLIILFIHLQRNDKFFLKVALREDKNLYFFHYHLLSLPIYIILLSLGELIVFFFIFLAVSLVPLVITKKNSINSLYDVIGFIPVRNFEFKSGLRQNFFMILILYAVSIGFYRYPYVALAAILLFTFISTTFYNESEPRQMLEVYQLSARKLLMLKIKNQLTDFTVIILPLIAIYLFSNLEYWYILLIFLLISFIIQTLAICLKYAFYEPEKNISKSIFIAVYALSVFVPFFVPVPLFMTIHYFRKAVFNLNNYLNDYA